jgi:hypothetical protein
MRVPQELLMDQLIVTPLECSLYSRGNITRGLVGDCNVKTFLRAS